MLRFYDREERFDEVVILGHIIYFEGCAMDMRIPDTLTSLVEEFGSEFEKHLSDIIFENLTILTNWGNSEEDYMAAASSDEEKVRAMAALAGITPQILAQDSSEEVRVYVVESLINDRRRNIIRDDSFLDAMLDDKTWVQSKIAIYGKKAHLDVLVKSDDISVLSEVIEHGYIDHLLELCQHKSGHIRELAAKKYQAVTEDQKDHKDALAEIEMNGYDAENPKHKEALASLDTAGKLEFIGEGYALDYFIADEDSDIRQAVAEQGYKLDVLMNDKDSNVAFTARSYPSYFDI